MAEQKAPPGPGSPPAGPSGPGGFGPPTGPPPPPPMGGYNGKILRVNLSSGSLTTEPLTYELARRWVGGAGLVAYYLWKELKGGEDALGPANKLIFALGPVTGLVFPGAARYCVGAKSPLTGGIAKAEAGGFWMAELKRAGFDAIIVEGQSARPVYLWINDGQASLKDASQLWGRETKETRDAIRAELGDEHIEAAMIGPAGENRVRYACIMTGLYDAAGRGGLGAVMGAKKLKAIAVRGHHLPPVANENVIKDLRQEIVSHPHHLTDMGTGGGELAFFEQSGNLPVRNMRDGLFPGAPGLSGIVMKQTIRQGMEGCFGCYVRCKKIVKFDEPFKCDPAYGGPEYETIAALGSDCGVDDLKTMCKGNERCNAYGLDTISTGASIAFAMECFEKGLISPDETGGLELRFGNGAAMLKAIDLIARREGIGDFIAEGTARMAKKLDRDTADFAMNVKGLESAMHDARTNMGFRIGYMINSLGADHCSSMGGGTSPMGLRELAQFGVLTQLKEDFGPRRMALYKTTQCISMVTDYLVMCLMPNVGSDQKLELLKATTGWNTGWVEMLQIAERILNTMRLFNLREGFTAQDDELPARFYQHKTDGALATKDIPDRATMEKARAIAIGV